MLAVAKGELKAKMLEYFRHIGKSGEELIVTDHRKPVLKIIPIKRKLKPDEAFGDLYGKVKYYEDINIPTMAEWGDI